MVHKFARAITRHHAPGTVARVEHDEAVSYCWLAVLQALDTYRSECGTSIVTHIYTALAHKARQYHTRDHAVLIHVPEHHVRSGGAYPVVSGTLDEPVSGDKYDADRGDKARAANAWAMAATDDTERVVERIALNQVLGRLSERDRHILLARAEGRSQEEIATEYNVSHQLVSLWLQKAIKRAREIAKHVTA